MVSSLISLRLQALSIDEPFETGGEIKLSNVEVKDA